MTTAGPSRSVRLFGTDAPVADVQRLNAGDLEVEFAQGNLRAIRFKGHEILRAIAYVVRDSGWGTFDPAISGLTVDRQAEHFEVRYAARCGEGLNYTAAIRGHADGTLNFSVTAMPECDFETNRCGFCVLHPIVGVAGKSVTVEHCDGTKEDAVFPDLIEPWQPFKSIRSLTHTPGEGIEATCRFVGDEFEMEDQRNWSDASYKTYARPLALPWPYIMPAATANTQTVELVLKVSPSSTSRANSANFVRVRVSNRPTGRKFAETGLLIMPDALQETLDHYAALEDIAPGFLLCHLDATAGHGQDELNGYAKLQSRSKCPVRLEYVAVADGDLNGEFRALATKIQRSGLRLDAMVVCPSVDRQSTPPGSTWPECPPLSDIYRSAREALPGLAIGGGMVSYFTELNRKRPPVALLDFVTHGTNPIVHAADDTSVMQTLEALPFIFRSAAQIMGNDRTYRLGPSYIPMRQNPYGSRVFDNSNARKTMAKMDPRQRGLFAASFMAGYAARVAEHDISSFVPASLLGPAGLLGGADERYPAFHLVRQLSKLAGQSVIESCSEDQAKILSLACCERAGRPSVLLSNITADLLTVTLDPGSPKGARTIIMIDEDSFPGARITKESSVGKRQFELQLKPYAVALLRYNV
ncbi:hypothetical protein [Phyllobacterium zundukense]|uniref:Uncharacterized protein n=1 Tax=Phyllobacterium zundukense TaxID=1867719 RepID=A0A2N9VZS9_9HYPH|nr:hypothetical protein [Phyllobacterium zundukense]ATU94361.1 hypothetical protein BLM14_21710 [Phyllobacterium zundukense]PIO44997.1 hypothetical protein B5P45_10070 [Phyllobacterium zundukense]